MTTTHLAAVTRPLKGTRAVAALMLCLLAFAALRGARSPIVYDDHANRPVLPLLRVPVNEAPAERLLLLPGVGPTLADRIVAERAIGGAFTSVDELQRVHGIGPATIAGMREVAEVGDGAR